MATQSRKRPAKTISRRPKAEVPAQTLPTGNKPSKLEQIVSMLVRPDGASLADLTTATGWQAHSVRGALAGSLKKKGYVIVSEKTNGVRRYRIEPTR